MILYFHYCLCLYFMKISILLVNYNTEQFIANFLADLVQQTLTVNDYEIIITNNVQNDVLETLLNQASLREKLNITIVSSKQNIGFGRAMNLAASHAQGEHLLIANPDLRMLQTDYLEKLLDHAQSQSYGVMTTQLINDLNEDKSEFHTFEFHETFGWDNQVNWFSGALLMIPQKVYQTLGGFDPDFFMYCEDEDLCLRIKKSGYALVKLDDLKIYHQGGSSEPSQNYDFFYRWYRSQILFAYKHFSQDKFQNLLKQLALKSRIKVIFYKWLFALFPTARHRFQYAQWSAMHDVVHKTLDTSTEWLFFRI